MKKLFKVLIVSTISALLIAGCGSAPPSATHTADTQSSNDQPGNDSTKDSVIVVMNRNSEPEAGFDPAYGWGAGEHVHEPLIQSTLTVTNETLGIDYDLATEIDSSDGGMTWTVKIRDDVYFTDGEKLDAYDVAFTYNNVKEFSTVSDFTMLHYAEAIDDSTVVFHMTTPYSIWPYTMAIVGIVPEHAYDYNYAQNPIGSGRYIMKQWDKGQQVIFEANPNYYAQTPKIKELTVLFMDEDAAFAAVRANQVDLAYTSAEYSSQVIDGYELLSFETVDNRGLSFPSVPSGTVTSNGQIVGNDVTADVAIRRAINIGINRNELIGNVLNGHGSPAYSVCDKMPWYNPASEVAYDFDEAISILEQNGWILADDEIRVKNGLRAELNIMYPASDPIRQALTADVSNQIRKLGIEVTTEGVGWDVAYSRAQSEIMTWGWGTHTPIEMYNIYYAEPESGFARYSPYSNPTVNQYMDMALQSSNLNESNELWQKAQWDGTTGTTHDGDIPWVWLVNIDHLYWATQDLNVVNPKIHPHGHGWSVVNSVDEWSWE